jgi:hypothetical protein
VNNIYIMRNTMRNNNLRLAALTFALAGLAGIGSALAANQSDTKTVTATIKFDTPLTLTKVADIDFGTVSTTDDAWTISTAGVVSHTGAGVQLYGTTARGNYTVSGSTTQAINITTANLVAGAHTTLSALKGDYGGAGSAAFPINGALHPGASTTIFLGATVTTSGAVSGTTETPTFDLTVIYQ